MMGEREHAVWEELLPLHALGALEGDERQAVEEHLASCADCRRELVELERDLGTLAAAPGAVDPPPEIRRRLLERVGQPPDERERERSSARWWPLAAAILLLIAGGLWLGAVEETRSLRDERDRLARELADAESRIATLLERQGTLVREIETLRDPGSRHVLLAGLETAPEASGRTVIDPAARSARFYAFDLPELSAAEDYQLWLIADGTPVSAGVFDVDEDGGAVVEVPSIPPLEAIDAWAVTIEPAGGVPRPTGEMVLKG